MAEQVYDTIRLDNNLTGDLPTAEYHVQLSGMEDRNAAAAAWERGLTGTLHVHRTMSGGSPVTWRDHVYRLTLTNAEYETLRDMIGKIVYFMPHRRDESDYASYREVVLIAGYQKESPLDPMETWWTLTVMLVDATGETVDS